MLLHPLYRRARPPRVAVDGVVRGEKGCPPDVAHACEVELTCTACTIEREAIPSLRPSPSVKSRVELYTESMPMRGYSRTARQMGRARGAVLCWKSIYS